MTNSEKTIFELFSDLRAITNYMNDSESLKKFYIKAVDLFNNKDYSDVNLQDDDGNTLLHYAMKANDVDWSEKILRRGANPYIKNNEGVNCFLMFNNGFSDNFMEIFK